MIRVILFIVATATTSALWIAVETAEIAGATAGATVAEDVQFLPATSGSIVLPVLHSIFHLRVNQTAVLAEKKNSIRRLLFKIQNEHRILYNKAIHKYLCFEVFLDFISETRHRAEKTTCYLI